MGLGQAPLFLGALFLLGNKRARTGPSVTNGAGQGVGVTISYAWQLSKNFALLSLLKLGLEWVTVPQLASDWYGLFHLCCSWVSYGSLSHNWQLNYMAISALAGLGMGHCLN
jgi:hypothetical protein